MKNKEKNGFSRLLLPEILTVLIGGAAVYGLGLLGKQLSVENALRDAVMAALGLAVSGFFLRREVVDSRLDYDNGEHLRRFWTAVWCSLLFSLTCAFLPAGGWPFLAVFVVLSLFSNLSVGIVFSGVFLMIGDLKERYKEQMLRKSLELLWDHNILVVCAAGNTGPEDGSISEMASSRKVLTVGCHDGRYCKNDPGRCETYSGRGRRYDVTRKPDIVAPGTRILSCNAFWQNRNGRIYRPYVAKSGTSMATPIVSGAAALAMEKYPGITNEEFVRLLSLTATDLGEPWNKQGFGMLNVRRLLENK